MEPVVVLSFVLRSYTIIGFEVDESCSGSQPVHCRACDPNGVNVSGTIMCALSVY